MNAEETSCAGCTDPCGIHILIPPSRVTIKIGDVWCQVSWVVRREGINVVSRVFPVVNDSSGKGK